MRVDLAGGCGTAAEAIERSDRDGSSALPG